MPAGIYSTTAFLLFPGGKWSKLFPGNISRSTRSFGQDVAVEIKIPAAHIRRDQIMDSVSAESTSKSEPENLRGGVIGWRNGVMSSFFCGVMRNWPKIFA